MRTFLFIGALSMVLLLANLSCKAHKSIETPLSANEQNHPVRALFLSSIDEFNNKNLSAFLENFAPDIKMYGTDGTYFGQEALHQRFEVLIRQYPNMKMDIPQLDLEILSEEVVLVNFKWKVYPMGQGPAFTGIGSGIYTYTENQWIEILEVETITHVDDALKQ